MGSGLILCSVCRILKSGKTEKIMLDIGFLSVQIDIGIEMCYNLVTKCTIAFIR